jgi:hypothetical protein
VRAFFIWMRGKLACLSRQIKEPCERSEQGFLAWVSPSQKYLDHWR